MRSDDQMARLTRRNIRARIHIESDAEFMNSLVFDRDSHEYPDPYPPNIQEPEILIRYRRRIHTAVQNYTPKCNYERKRIEEFVAKEQERLNKRIGGITMPSPEEYGVDSKILTAFRKARLSIGGLSGRTVTWDHLRTLYSASIDTLRYLSAYASVAKHCSDEQVTICNAFRYAKGDSKISFTNVVEIEDNPFAVPFGYTVDGEEVPLFESKFDSEYISFEYDNLRDRLDGFIFGVALGALSNIYLFNNSRLAHGAHKDGTISYRRPFLTRDRNIIFHEFFHVIQNLFSAIDSNIQDSSVDLDGEYQPTEFGYVEDNSPFVGVQADMLVLWRQFFADDIDALCDYQKKNVHEFFAVAFEYYVEVPEKLKREQPDVYDLIETIVG